MTFSVKEKLGFAFSTQAERISKLTEMAKKGMTYSAMVNSEHWPVFAALLDSKSEQAVQKLRKRWLTEEERVEANVVANFIDELNVEIQTEIKRAALANNELNKIKEKKNV